MKICLSIYFILSIMLNSQWALSIYRPLYLYNTGNFFFYFFATCCSSPIFSVLSGPPNQKVVSSCIWSLMSSNFLPHILLYLPSTSPHPQSSESIFKYIFQFLYWISYFGNPIFNFPKLFLVSCYSFIPKAYFIL